MCECKCVQSTLPAVPMNPSTRTQYAKKANRIMKVHTGCIRRRGTEVRHFPASWNSATTSSKRFLMISRIKSRMTCGKSYKEYQVIQNLYRMIAMYPINEYRYVFSYRVKMDFLITMTLLTVRTVAMIENTRKAVSFFISTSSNGICKFSCLSRFFLMSMKVHHRKPVPTVNIHVYKYIDGCIDVRRVTTFLNLKLYNYCARGWIVN